MRKLLALFILTVTILCLFTACDTVNAQTANAGCKRAIERFIEHRIGIVSKNDYRLMYLDSYWKDTNFEESWKNYQANIMESCKAEAAEYYGNNITYTVTVSDEKKASDEELSTLREKLKAAGDDPSLLKAAYRVDFVFTISGSEFSENSSGNDTMFIFYNGQWYAYNE